MTTLNQLIQGALCCSFWVAKLQAAAVQLSGVATHPFPSNLEQPPPVGYAPIPWRLTIPTNNFSTLSKFTAAPGSDEVTDEVYFFTFTGADCWADGHTTLVNGEGFLEFYDGLGSVGLWVRTFKPPLEEVLINPPEFIVKVEAGIGLELSTPLGGIDRAKALQFLESTPEFSNRIGSGSEIQLDAAPYARWAQGTEVSWVVIPEPATSFMLAAGLLVLSGVRRKGVGGGDLSQPTN